MMAVTNLAGVTSKAGLKAATPRGVIRRPARVVTSEVGLSSIGISSPDFRLKSMVLTGAAT